MFPIALLLVVGCQVSPVQALSVLRGSVFQAGQVAQPVEAFSFLSIGQAPGATPAYVHYGKPEFTTFNNVSSACRACVEFWPEKEDGKRFHQKKYDDPNGGVWDRGCRAGKCDFRDPQTDPVGGVIGRGVGPNGAPDGKTCITRDPVPWFTDCEPVLLESTSTLLDATRYCSYKEQIYIPPPAKTVSRFAVAKNQKKPQAWARIGGTNEQCLATIEREGAALFDGMSFCDSDMPALSGCCETVYSALTCVAETASAKTGASQEGIFADLSVEGKQMMETFSKYCVPLCQQTKPEFCAKTPEADICVNPTGCTECTARGGLWCPKLESCHCASENPPCIDPPVTEPLFCPYGDKNQFDGGHRRRQKAAAKKAGDGDDKALCKYAEMARMWKPRR